MVNETDTEPEVTGRRKERYPLLDVSRKMFLAGIGAMALAQDEVEDIVSRLVERGELAEKDGKKLVRELIDRRMRSTLGSEDEISKRVESILDRMNVPNKADIEALSLKITVLTKKVDELKKASSRQVGSE